jgi:hypothetical protein
MSDDHNLSVVSMGPCIARQPGTGEAGSADCARFSDELYAFVGEPASDPAAGPAGLGRGVV